MLLQLPDSVYQNAANLLIIEKWPLWQTQAWQFGCHADIRVTGTAIALILGAGSRAIEIEQGQVCYSTGLFRQTGQILVETQGLYLKVYPDEFWKSVRVSYLRRPKTKG